MVKITAEEKNKGKRMKRNQDSLRELLEIKHTNIQIIGVPEEEVGKEMATLSSILPGESQGHTTLVGCCLWGCTELTEAT